MRLPLSALCLLTLLPVAASAQTSEALPQQAPSAQSSTSPAQSAASSLPTPKLPHVSARQRRKADDAFLAGARQLDRDRPQDAIADFARAAQLDPANPDYTLALAVAREHRVTQLVQQAGDQTLQGHKAEADTLLAQAQALDPTSQIVTQHIDALAAPPPALAQIHLSPTSELGGALQLTPNNNRESFHIRSSPAELIRTVARAYGIAVTFDSTLAEAGAQVRIDLDDVTYDQAMPVVLLMDHAFAVPLTGKSMLVARDSPENRQRLEPLLLQSFNVPLMLPAQLTELSNMIRNVFDVKQISIAHSNGITVRAPEKTLKAIDLMLSDMFDGGSQVVLDMRVYSLDNTSTLKLGVNLPQTLGAYNLESTAQQAIAANQDAINQAVANGIIKLNGTPTQNFFTELAFLFAAGLLNSSQFSNTIAIFGGGLSTTAIFAGGASLNFGYNSSDTRVLDAIQTRVFDGQDSVIRIGTRYPIATAIYSSSVPNLPPGIANSTVNGTSVQNLLNQFSGAAASIPQFSYEDLGLTLKTTPTIQKSGMVTLRLDFKIEALAGGSLNSVPILNNRSLTSTVTVADGATALIASNLTQSESNAVTGTPGLSEIPGFQSVPNSNLQKQTGRMVILVTPHIVRRRSNLLAGPRIAFNLPLGSN